MAKITNLMRKLGEQIFPDSEDQRTAFLEALVKPAEKPASAVICTRPGCLVSADLEVLDRALCPGWLPENISFLSDRSISPGKSKLFDEGAIYPMDVSSVFTASAMLEASSNRRILDACAAPGGKSIFAAVLLKPEFLLSNELVGKRLGILRHNMTKCGIDGFTQRLEPHELAELIPGAFDLVLADAPCSGQSLLAKGIKNPGCFHPNIVKGNARRQLRIVCSLAECVAKGGFLFYSTCTFSPKENETVVEKFLGKFPEFQSVAVPHLKEMKSSLSREFCYRIYPHQGRGAGGFVALLQKSGESPAVLPSLPEEVLKYPVPRRDGHS